MPGVSSPTVTSPQASSPFDGTSPSAQPAYTKPNDNARRGTTPAPASIDPAPLLVPFKSKQDRQAFEARQSRLANYDIPNARKLARDFIKQTLDVDGDEYVVAHFNDDHDRADGRPDKTFTLTEAVMQNFPGFRHRGVIPFVSDEISFYQTAGVNPIGEVRKLMHSKNAGNFFSNLWQSMVNRTGPGYLYNLARNKNPASESIREIDEAFGIYKKNHKGEQTYTDSNLYRLAPSAVYEKFQAGTFTEVPYISKLNRNLDTYWNQVRRDWPSAKRYQFLEEARDALNNGELTKDDFKLVMKGAVPHLPLKPPYALKDIDQAALPHPSVRVARFDINGYPATDIVRFIGPDHKEVMYMPGNQPPFVVFHNDKERTDWVIEQAKDPARQKDLLRHFSIYNRQDGTFHSGVKSALDGLADGSWSRDGGYINHDNQLIEDDIFKDLQQQVEHRLREDSAMQTRTAAEAWRDTIYMWSVLVPIGPGTSIKTALITGKLMQLGVQTGGGVETAVDGKTYDEREDGLVQAGIGGAYSPM